MRLGQKDILGRKWTAARARAMKKARASRGKPKSATVGRSVDLIVNLKSVVAEMVRDELQAMFSSRRGI